MYGFPPVNKWALCVLGILVYVYSFLDPSQASFYDHPEHQKHLT